jgi:hypothetical protein
MVSVSHHTFLDGKQRLPNPPDSGASIILKRLQRTCRKRRAAEPERSAAQIACLANVDGGHKLSDKLRDSA